jgi:hypothetical protein
MASQNMDHLLRTSQQALRLPPGILRTNVGGCLFEVGFNQQQVVAAADILIKKQDTRGVKSQAEVIARAGKHGWGEGDVYSATGGGEVASADTIAIRDLVDPEDVLNLQKGRLRTTVGGMGLEIGFEDKQVLDAARYLIGQGDTRGLVSQASVIARAGKLGWGEGDIFTTM